MFREFESQFLKQSATRVGSKYKKAVYTLYKNASFTEKVEPKQRKSERGILGPVIRAQIRDVIRVSSHLSAITENRGTVASPDHKVCRYLIITREGSDGFFLFRSLELQWNTKGQIHLAR